MITMSTVFTLYDVSTFYSFSWYANETNIDNKYGQFRKLAKTASEDLSKIQEYVNYIGWFPKFSYFATPDVKAAMAQYNTVESLELHDQNINTAKEHANDWNATVSIFVF